MNYIHRYFRHQSKPSQGSFRRLRKSHYDTAIFDDKFHTVDTQYDESVTLVHKNCTRLYLLSSQDSPQERPNLLPQPKQKFQADSRNHVAFLQTVPKRTNPSNPMPDNKHSKPVSHLSLKTDFGRRLCCDNLEPHNRSHNTDTSGRICDTTDGLDDKSESLQNNCHGKYLPNPSLASGPLQEL
jgi:hypothetical protein